MSASQKPDPPLVVSLADALSHGVEAVGGKAFTLSALLDAGFAVPDGVVVTTEAHRRWLESATLPNGLLDGIEGEHAFRSSAVGEDGADASFAGQYVTVLSVTAEKAKEALTTCWSSAHSAAVDEYVQSIGHDGGAIAILVQRMVDADCAGVAFTANPVTGADEMVIEAVRGLADELLDGKAQSERWTIDAEPTCASTAPDVLTAELVTEIGKTCREIERFLGGPQDIEWAIADGTLFILQSRPITALPIAPTDRPPENQTWTRDDSHFAGPVLPFLASVWLPIHADCFVEVAEASGMPFDTIRTRVYGGRVYARLEPLGDGGTGRDDRRPPPAWLLSVLMRVVPAFRKRIDNARRVIATDLPMTLIDDYESEGRDAATSRTRELLAIELVARDDAGLADHIDAVLDHIKQCGLEHFRLAIISTASTTGMLGRRVQRETAWSLTEIIDLVSGYGAASTASGRSICALAAAIANDAEARRLLDEEPLALRDHDGPGGEAFRTFLEERGHRPYGYAIDEPMWAENPLPLIRLLRSHLRGIAEQADPRDVSRRAEERLRQELGSATIWPEVEQLLTRARRARPYQDETEDLCFEAFGVLRYAGLEAARRFVDRGLLDRVDDLWFCTIDEVLGGLRTGRLAPDIERRRGEYRWSMGNDLGAVLGPQPQPPPDFSFPKQVDDYLGGLFWFLLAEGHTHPPDPSADLTGVGCSPGQVTGPVKIIRAAEEIDRIEPGDILVCPCTTASWSVAFPLVAGLITEVGGPLSHPATLAREYGIAGVLGVANATSLLRDGEIVRIDGARGAIWRGDSEP